MFYVYKIHLHSDFVTDFQDMILKQEREKQESEQRIVKAEEEKKYSVLVNICK